MDGDKGVLRISNEADRSAVAAILFNNGYVVQKVKRTKPGSKKSEIFVKYSLPLGEDSPGGDENESQV